MIRNLRAYLAQRLRSIINWLEPPANAAMLVRARQYAELIKPPILKLKPRGVSGGRAGLSA